MTYAIVKTGGKQYRVEPGQTLLVERLRADEGAKVALQPLMFRDDKKVVDDATRWLRQHRYDAPLPKPVDDAEAERGRRRKARGERKRMRRTANAAARKRIREQ